MTYTLQDEGPQCPHCGRQYTADDAGYYDERSYTEETCDECDATFSVEVIHTTSWRCVPRDSDASLAEDPKGLSGEAVAARAEGIAQVIDSTPTSPTGEP